MQFSQLNESAFTNRLNYILIILLSDKNSLKYFLIAEGFGSSGVPVLANRIPTGSLDLLTWNITW